MNPQPPVAGAPIHRDVQYKPPGPTVTRFFKSEAFVRGLRGPIGSGKSTACVIEILRRAQMQAPGFDGVRRTRWAIIRNSYPELKTTTLKTWGDWCPPQFGRLTMDSPIRHHIRTQSLDIEVLFIALDREDDARKLLSLELTGAWINEAREIPKAIVDALTGRVGRYPSRTMGGCTWSGIIMDTNPPDDQSWWYKMAEEEEPHGWEFFSQPGGDSESAENIENLPRNYYGNIIPGKDPDWIKVYVKGEYGFVTEGKPVYPMYRDSTHCTSDIIVPTPEIPLVLGADFGLTPAAAILQKQVNGRYGIIDEYCTTECGITRFGEGLLVYMNEQYPEFEIGAATGDPAGSQRAQTDERTPFEILISITKWKWKPAPTNDFLTRREGVVTCLNRLVDGRPGLEVSPKAAMIRKGFSGGYHFKIVKNGNGVQTHETPAKNEYSHPHDGLQYGILGAGEYNALRKPRRPARKPDRMARDVDYDMFGGR